MGTASPSFRKIVERRFEARMREALPQFELSRRATSLGEQNYRLNLIAEMDLFVVLFADSRREQLGLSVGWARPGVELISCRFEGPEHIEGTGQIFSLAFFWGPHDIVWRVTKARDDAMCLSARKAGDICFLDREIEQWIADYPSLYAGAIGERERRIYPLVDHMFGRLLEHGVPYFEHVAARVGVPLRLRQEL